MHSPVPTTPDSLLRTAPRQVRSERRINLILDTAASLFDEIGYDATTTKHVADRAGIAVGSIYHWFPDKTALANALAERYLNELLEVYRRDLQHTPGERTPDLIGRVAELLSQYANTNPAFVSLLVNAFAPGGDNSPGERLRVGMFTQVRALIEWRVPNSPPEDSIAISDTIVCITHAMLAFAARFTGEERKRRIDEMSYAIMAYVVTKYPNSSAADETLVPGVLKPVQLLTPDTPPV
jgi:AcrR family transcriptional regulator